MKARGSFESTTNNDCDMLLFIHHYSSIIKTRIAPVFLSEHPFGERPFREHP